MKRLKTNKYIAIISGIIVVLSITVCFFVDNQRLKVFKLPIFCIEKNNLSEDGYKQFIGLGYSYNILSEEKQHLPQDYPIPDVTKYVLKICGKTIKSVSAGLRNEIAKGTIVKIEKESNNKYPYIIYVDEGLNIITKMRVYSDSQVYSETDLCIGDKVNAYSEFYPITVVDDIFPALEVYKE